jgi:hypothetical protein
VVFLAESPQAGDLMKETGGCRKVRIAKDGVGKSGGYRVTRGSVAAIFRYFC